MQAKKEQVRREIEAAALHVFFEQGYPQARIGDIAARCGISTGNVYTYFGSKKQLFETVIPPSLVEHLNELLVQAIRRYNERGADSRYMENPESVPEESAATLMEYRKQIVILLEKSEGTIYAGHKEKLIDLMVDTKWPYTQSSYERYAVNEEENRLLLHIVCTSLVDLFLDLLKRELSDASRLALYKALHVYRLHGVNGLND
ncbi:TetR family transcriptional regulator [Saccharibacillus sp. O23]|uniref:TetR/AcrR family transcriptional regulator n=1 Tax=Saccharibacillus sp. O23 TaxID=2009338 RepID=UPI000B4E6F12|nr:TetR/AcrR family transcriptional regulator [Saccharibacillus sp. O23]OWR32783.1 TetR family transcriptional regulator [Saccharibacillus sp. O23]